MNKRPLLIGMELGLILTLSASALAQGVGSIRGMVYDKDFEAPLPLAQITVAETGARVQATEQGNYVIEELPPGTYTLIFVKDGYTRQIRTDVLVTPGQLTDLDIWMSGEFVEMEEFVVRDVQLAGGTEAGLLQLRMEAPALMDSISAELMSRAGAGDAAAALRLVAGATVQDGKFAVIRGLPDRYVNSQLNGIRLPSADAETRAVELDQFPSAVIESIQVSKTFTPDQQGDASGGAVNVVLKGIPDENILQLGVGTGFNTQVMENRDKFLTYKGGGVSFLGVDDGGRDQVVDRVHPNGRDVLANPQAIGVSRGTAPFDYDWDLTAGGRHEFDNDVRIGGLVNIFYKRGASFTDNKREDTLWLFNGRGTPLIPRFSGEIDSVGGTSLLDITEASEQLKIGGLAAFGVETEHHALNLIFLHTRTTEDTAILAEDTRSRAFFNPDFDPTDPFSFITRGNASFIRFETLKYEERLTQTLQLTGKHTLPINPLGVEDFFQMLSPQLDWSVSANHAGMNEPDRRQFGSSWVPEANFFDIFILPSRHSAETPAAQFLLGNVQRTWQEITEDSDQFSINLKLPFEQWSGDEGYFKFGLFDDRVKRQFRQDSFSNFNSFPENPNPGLDGQPWEFFWSSSFLTEGYIIGRGPDIDIDYRGSQDMSAWYYMIDLPLNRYLKLIGGARFETVKIGTQIDPGRDARVIPPGSDGGRTLFDPITGQRVLDPDTGLLLGDSQFSQSDVLPSIGVVVTPWEPLTIRAGYAETVARQTFRELTPIAQQEFLGGDVFVGNPNLKMSALKNYDIRVDYRPYNGGLFSVSWFRKDIDQPIEYIQSFAVDSGRYTTPVNFPSGRMLGYELETRHDLGFFWEELLGLSMGANATFISSRVDVSESEIATLDRALLAPVGSRLISSREMLQAPEYLANFFVTYDVESTGTQLGLFYTLQGDTLKVGPGQIASFFVPAIYETEHDSLNFTLSQKIGEHIKVKFAAKNLTNTTFKDVYRSEFIPGDTLRSSYRKGIDLSVSISAEFKF